jgi:N-acetylglucosaminyldiphosphoundecaprenol N-acetyl-beta-D-mannosaminyltransferase
MTATPIEISPASPSWSERDTLVDVLGVKVSALNLDEVVATLSSWREAGRREYVCCVCVHGIVSANLDPEIRNALNGAGLATKDGMPVALWSRAAGHASSRRVCGSDVMEAMCALGEQDGSRHFFYGSTPSTLKALEARLKSRFPGLVIAGMRSPPFRPLTPEEEDAEIAAINAARPDYVWVGLGMPKQERWMARFVGRVEATALLGVGAAFDFHAGVKRRAPAWMQRSGLEWLFRLGCEPRRLARRYVIDNAIFLGLAARHMAGRGVRGRFAAK